MASYNTVLKHVLDVKGIVINNMNVRYNYKNEPELIIDVRPDVWHQNRCPICGKKCPGYDRPTKSKKLWRSNDWNGMAVYLASHTNRILCPEHGVLVANVPWAYSNSSFTKSFEFNVSWLARELPRSAIAKYMRIDWKSVGRCVERVLSVLEPDRNERLNGLVNIGIDKTSYKNGHKYITVVVNHDTNTVVWTSKGYGKTVLEQFFKLLTPKQRESIKVVSGDGARWITDCVNEYLPNCERCVDSFHVVEWAMAALDEVRIECWREAAAEVKKLEKQFKPSPGRPRSDNEQSKEYLEAKENAKQIKNSSIALGKAPENLTESQQIKIDMIASTKKKLYRAYKLKELLRLLLKLKSYEEAKKALDSWLWKASHSRITSMYELNLKIRRHYHHILNTIRLGFSNARVESINNKIKLVIRKSYGFRNVENMLNMVYLVCSNLVIPLPNRSKHRGNAYE